jgi:D-glycero-alpha-D-manno-heptose-7-phosphate kinase
MIICQTPFRVSFAGGGTDLPAFYEQGYGAVLSVALKHHMYVTVHQRFENNVRVSYSKTEIADTIDEVQHDLVREAMRATNTSSPIEVTTIADVPAGTGLGSSSTLTVGLLNAFSAFNGRISSPEYLARESCRIEIDVLKNPIGKQDQYAAAYGGINYIRFNPDGSVHVEPVPIKGDAWRELEKHTLMLYTANRRSASAILRKQSEGTAEKRTVLRTMRDLADEMRNVLCGEANFHEFGRLLNEGWQLKRSLGFGISNEAIDDWYDAARSAGAWGGKLLGAGGGGFVLLFAPPETHGEILEKLGHPQHLPFAMDGLGSRIVFISS